MRALTLEELGGLSKWLHDKCVDDNEDYKKFLRIHELFLARAELASPHTVSDLMDTLDVNDVRGTKLIKVRVGERLYDIEFVTEETDRGTEIVVLNTREEED